MSLKTQIAYDNVNTFTNPDHFGQPVTYTTYGSETNATFNTIFNENPENITPEFDGKYRLRIGELGFSTEASGIANPGRNDTVQILKDDGVTSELWTVTRVLDITDGWARVEVSRPEVLTKGNPFKERR